MPASVRVADDARRLVDPLVLPEAGRHAGSLFEDCRGVDDGGRRACGANAAAIARPERGDATRGSDPRKKELYVAKLRSNDR
jgi:hypothetical protein